MRTMIGIFGSTLFVGCLPPDGGWATQDDYETLLADHEALQDQYTALSADVAALSAALEAQSSAQTSTLDSLTADVAALEDWLTDIDPAGDGSGLVRVLAEDTTWTVSDAAGLLAALSALDGYRIASGVVATIALDPGTYVFSEALRIEHPDGARIAIVGDVGDPQSVILSFADTHGVVLLDGQSLGYLGGMTISGSGSHSGIYLYNGAQLQHGELLLTDWETGLRLELGSALSYASSLGIREETDAQIEATANTWGLVATHSGVANLGALNIHHNNGSGLVVERNAMVSAPNSQFTNNSGYGGTAQYGGSVALVGAHFDDNSNAGIYVTRGSYGYLDQISASGNGEVGLGVSVGSVVTAFDTGGASFAGNAQAGVNVAQGSFARLDRSVSSANADSGFYAGYGSTMVLDQASATGNTDGIFCEHGGFVSAVGMSTSANSRYGAYQVDNCTIYANSLSSSANGTASTSEQSWGTSNWIYE